MFDTDLPTARDMGRLSWWHVTVVYIGKPQQHSHDIVLGESTTTTVQYVWSAFVLADTAWALRSINAVLSFAEI